ncbi:hypothetical protein ABIE67_010092 [Streptomyces sp. V4I8]
MYCGTRFQLYIEWRTNRGCQRFFESTVQSDGAKATVASVSSHSQLMISTPIGIHTPFSAAQTGSTAFKAARYRNRHYSNRRATGSYLWHGDS